MNKGKSTSFSFYRKDFFGVVVARFLATTKCRERQKAGRESRHHAVAQCWSRKPLRSTTCSQTASAPAAHSSSSVPYPYSTPTALTPAAFAPSMSKWRSPIMATVEGRSMSSLSAWFTSTVLLELWLSMAGPTTASRCSARPKCSTSRSRNSFGLEETTAVLTPAS